MNIISKFNGKPPLLLKGNIFHYYKNKEHLNIVKAKYELGYNPGNSKEALIEAFIYLREQ